MNRISKFVLVVVIAGLAMQLVPYGKDHTNPALVREPAWDSPATRELAKKACFDCHSNETVWPWYSRIAPVSWLVQWDIVAGREHLNFSDWRDGAREGERPQKISKEVIEGEMPPLQYTLAHPEARLDGPSKKLLSEGLAATTSKAARR